MVKKLDAIKIYEIAESGNTAFFSRSLEFVLTVISAIDVWFLISNLSLEWRTIFYLFFFEYVARSNQFFILYTCVMFFLLFFVCLRRMTVFSPENCNQ